MATQRSNLHSLLVQVREAAIELNIDAPPALDYHVPQQRTAGVDVSEGTGGSDKTTVTDLLAAWRAAERDVADAEAALTSGAPDADASLQRAEIARDEARTRFQAAQAKIFAEERARA